MDRSRVGSPRPLALLALAAATTLPAAGVPARSSAAAFPSAPPATVAPTLEDFTLEGDLAPFVAKRRLEYVAPDVSVFHLTLRSEEPATPPPFTLVFSVPAVGIDAFWNPDISVDKARFWNDRFTSRATTQAPVIALLGNDDRNRLTFAVSEVRERLDLSSALREEDARFYNRVAFFSEPAPATDRYEVDVRIDTRGVHLAEALADVARWWASADGYAPAPVPEAARRPMYSTWYAFHQKLDQEAVLAELRRAHALGYEAVIVDDGWQTLDASRGYAYTGDWRPERIPDMRGFVDRVHELGMKFLLWYSLPFVGERSRVFRRFEGKYLWHWQEQGAWVLDPRYPEVREWIIGTYERALREWDLDGFKFDFLDRFVPDEHTEMTAADGRDHASVQAAVDRLMHDVMARLRQIDPDVLIEFRQRYTGPLMRRYGNMFRGVDCPGNAIANRVEITDLRLLSGDTAVHGDMLMWHRDESVEHSAQQLLAVMFAVPQLSVRLTELPAEQVAMVRFWTQYWQRNRDVLLEGTFRPSEPAALYPLLRAQRDGRAIVGLYGDRVVEFGDARALDVINATPRDRVVVRTTRDLGERSVAAWDATGTLRYRRTARLDAGVHELAVPPSGLLRVR